MNHKISMRKKNLEQIIELLAYRGKKKTYAMLLIFVIFIASSNFLVSFMLQLCIDAARNQRISELTGAGVLLIILSIFCGIFYYLYEKEQERLKQEIAMALKTKVFGQWIQANFKDTRKIKEGEMITYMTEDADKCGGFVAYTLFPLLQIVLCITIGSIYTLFYAWQIFLLVLALAVLFVMILSKLFSRIGKAYDEKQDKIAKQKNVFMECFLCSDIIKINRLMNPIFAIHKIVSGERVRAEVNLMKEKTWSKVFMENGILMIEMIVLFTGVVLVRNNILTVGAMIGVWNAAIGTFVYPFMDFPEVFSGVAEAAVSFERIKGICNLPTEGKPDTVEDGCQEIQLKNITYKEDETVILDHIFLNIKQKELILIEGESGSGKSTLARVLLGQASPQSGNIYFDFKEKDRHHYGTFFSYVPQGNSLLNMSLKENILLGSEEWAEKEIDEMTVHLKLGERMRELPKRWDSIVPEDVALSEGQAQRMAIIRALAHKAPFILLDEPFLALDEESAMEVVKILNREKQNHGVIIITHKIPSPLKADKRYRMEKGRLYEKQ